MRGRALHGPLALVGAPFLDARFEFGVGHQLLHFQRLPIERIRARRKRSEQKHSKEEERAPVVEQVARDDRTIDGGPGRQLDRILHDRVQNRVWKPEIA